MRRLPLILATVAVLIALGLLSSLVTQGFRDVAEAEQERDRLLAEKIRLERHIGEIEETLTAVRHDPAAVEAIARRDLGWVRPGEKVLLLPTPPPVATPPALTARDPTPILSLPD